MKELKELSKKIFETLKAQKKTQKELSKFTGIGEPAISQWKVDGTNPKAEDLSRIALFLNVSADYLLGLTDCPTTAQTQTEPNTKILTLYNMLDMTNQVEVMADIKNRLVWQGYLREEIDEILTADQLVLK
jgi:transcriptional regulator with XRE-family HTH domain